MTRLLLSILICLPLLSSCAAGDEVPAEAASSAVSSPAEIQTYLDGYFSNNACPNVLGFDHECTPSGLCTVAITCYASRTAGYSGYSYAFSLVLDLMCLGGTCTLSTY